MKHFNIISSAQKYSKYIGYPIIRLLYSACFAKHLCNISFKMSKDPQKYDNIHHKLQDIIIMKSFLASSTPDMDET